MPRKFEKWSVAALATSRVFASAEESLIGVAVTAPIAAMSLYYLVRHLSAGFARWQLYPLYFALALALLPSLIAPLRLFSVALPAPFSLLGTLPAVPSAPSWVLITLIAVAFVCDRLLFPVTALPLPPGPHKRLRAVRHRFVGLSPVPREHPMVEEYQDSAFAPRMHHPFYECDGVTLSPAAAAAAQAQSATFADALRAAHVAATQGVPLSARAVAPVVYPAGEHTGTRSPAAAAAAAPAAAGAPAGATAGTDERKTSPAPARCVLATASTSSSEPVFTSSPSLAPASASASAPVPTTPLPLNSERPFEILDLTVMFVYPAATAHGGDRGDSESFLPPYLSPWETTATASFASLPLWLFSSLQMMTQHIRVPFVAAEPALPTPPPPPSSYAHGSGCGHTHGHGHGGPWQSPVQLPPGYSASVLPAGTAAAAAALASATAFAGAGAETPAEAALSSSSWPVVLLSHGLGGTAEVYLTIAQAIASYGHIVVAPTHTDGSSSIALPYTANESFYARPQDQWLVRRRRRQHVLGDPAPAQSQTQQHQHQQQQQQYSAKVGSNKSDAADAAAAAAAAAIAAVQAPWQLAELAAAACVVNVLPATAEAMGGGGLNSESEPVPEADDDADHPGDGERDDEGWDPLAPYNEILNTKSAPIDSAASASAPASSNGVTASGPLCVRGYVERGPVRNCPVTPAHLERKLEREMRAVQLARRAREVRFVLDVLTLAEQARWAPGARVAVRSDVVAAAPEVYIEGQRVGTLAAAAAGVPSGRLAISLPLYPVLGAPTAAAAPGGSSSRGTLTCFHLGDVIPSLRPRAHTVHQGGSASGPNGAGVTLLLRRAPVPAPPVGRFDLRSRLWAAGHSFGGATTLVLSARDPRVRACATADPWIYPVPPVVTHADVPLPGEQRGSVILPPAPKDATARALAKVGRRPASGAVLGGVGRRWGPEPADPIAAATADADAGPPLSRRPPSRLSTPGACPVLTLASEKWEVWRIHHNALRRMSAVFAAATPLSVLATLPGTRHSNFMDAPFWAPATTAWMEASGTTDPTQTLNKSYAVTAAFVAAVLAGPAGAAEMTRLRQEPMLPASGGDDDDDDDGGECSDCGHIPATPTPADAAVLGPLSSPHAPAAAPGSAWATLTGRARRAPPSMAAAMRMHLAHALVGAVAPLPPVPKTAAEAAAGRHARARLQEALAAVATAASAAVATAAVHAGSHAAAAAAARVPAGAAVADAAGEGPETARARSAALSADEAALAACAEARAGDEAWTVVEEVALQRGPGAAHRAARPPAAAAAASVGADADAALLALVCEGAGEGAAAARELVRRLDDREFAVDALEHGTMERVARNAFV